MQNEIGAIVKTVGAEGRVEVRKLGGSFPWVYGEGVVDLLGDDETISGILSFGSRHVSHESLNGQLRQVVQQLATLSGFGSDGLIAMKFGAIANCIQLLHAFCETQFE